MSYEHDPWPSPLWRRDTLPRLVIRDAGTVAAGSIIDDGTRGFAWRTWPATRRWPIVALAALTAVGVVAIARRRRTS